MTYLITILRRDGSRYKYQAAKVPAELKLGGDVVAYKVVQILEEETTTTTQGKQIK